MFSQAAANGGAIRGICVPGGGKFSRSDIEELTQFVAGYGAKGLAWMKVTEQGFESNIVKFFSADELAVVRQRLAAQPGDLVLFLADTSAIVAAGLGALRLKVGKTLNLIDAKALNFLWVVDFPLFEWDAEEKRWNAVHHPFTAPKTNDSALLRDKAQAGGLCARAYDVVLNGTELGGGSIRIHTKEMQDALFAALGISPEDAQLKFGFLLEALSYGAPPHGGVALGFDRLCALMLGEESIREVIAFPKTQKAACPLSGAPSRVGDKQLRELYLKHTMVKKDTAPVAPETQK